MTFDDWELPEEQFVRAAGKRTRPRWRWEGVIGKRSSGKLLLSHAGSSSPISLPSSAPTDGESTVTIGPAKGRI